MDLSLTDTNFTHFIRPNVYFNFNYVIYFAQKDTHFNVRERNKINITNDKKRNEQLCPFNYDDIFEIYILSINRYS